MSLKEAAIELATRRGWEVFPARPKAKTAYKSAASSNGRRWGATRDPDEIERDFEQWPRANIGLPTGRSNGIWATDEDTMEGHGVDGPASMAQLESANGVLPPTLTSHSPSGSVHRFWRYPEGKVVRNSSGRLAPGIDVRGEGGMVIAPPSRRGADEYRWVDPAAEVAEAPQWLLNLVQEDERPEVGVGVGANPFTEGANRPPVDDAELAAAIQEIPNTGDGGWEEWNRVAMAIYRATDGSDLGLLMFDEWSKKNPDKYDAGDTMRRWHVLGTSPPTHIGVGTILWMADQNSPGWRQAREARDAMVGSGVADEDARHAPEEPGDPATHVINKSEVKLSDFWACMENHTYIYEPTGSMWPQASVASRFGKVPIVDEQGRPVLDDDGEMTMVSASNWLDIHRPVEQVVWSPGMPTIIKNRHLREGGWVPKGGAQCYNMYRPPAPIWQRGSASRAQPWIDHGEKLYGDQAPHMVRWMAHHVQRPGVKVNHSLVLSGLQGSGKDTWIEPLKVAVGPWNFTDISPHDILSPYSGYLQSVVIRISETRDLGDVNRYQFYERTKIMMAAPPDVIRVNEKYIRERAIVNCCGAVLTTNTKTSLYLPEDDRRHYVAWSEVSRGDYEEGYWTKIWSWYSSGGFADVAAYLMELDLSQFDAYAPPPKTQAFYEIVESSRSPEMSEMTTIMMAMGDPDAVTMTMVTEHAAGMAQMSTFYEWLTDRRNQRSRPRIMGEAGYVSVRNPQAENGLWRLRSEKCVIYAKASLTGPQRMLAAERLARGTVTPAEPPHPPSGGTITPITRGRRSQ